MTKNKIRSTFSNILLAVYTESLVSKWLEVDISRKESISSFLSVVYSIILYLYFIYLPEYLLIIIIETQPDPSIQLLFRNLGVYKDILKTLDLPFNADLLPIFEQCYIFLKQVPIHLSFLFSPSRNLTDHPFL